MSNENFQRVYLCMTGTFDNGRRVEKVVATEEEAEIWFRLPHKSVEQAADDEDFLRGEYGSDEVGIEVFEVGGDFLKAKWRDLK